MFYSRFSETLTTDVLSFVAKFACSLQSSEIHTGIHKPFVNNVPDWPWSEVGQSNFNRVVYKLVCEFIMNIWTLQQSDELVNFTTKSRAFVVKVVKSTVNDGATQQIEY